TGFTLIEILTVIAIIGILMGIVIPVIGEANRKSKIANVKATIAKIEIALSSYESDWSDFPPSGSNLNDTSSQNLYYYLYKTRRLGGAEYMKIKKSEINNNNQLLDPWKGTYKVNVTNPIHNTETFDISSDGPDATQDSEDDIDNWTRE
ncbi:type II secretion system protein, partial [Candidatus Auribacterota bacterium]